MKINIANPPLALQKTIEVEDEQKLLAFYEKRIGAEVPVDMLGDEWAGYVLRITGGNDKQGFPMKQGVLKNGRVKLLFKKGMSCYKERRGGMRKRKSVRGCIVGHDLAILSTVVAKKGNGEIPGLTDSDRPKRLGPKRASRIRSMFDLEKADDVKKFVIRRVVKEGEGGKKGVTKAPKIQRLVTANRLQRKRRVRKTMVKAIRANRDAKKEYAEKMHAYSKAQKDKRAAEVSKKNKRKEKKATA